MADYEYIKNPTNGVWTVLATRRAKRPNEAKQLPKACPFCAGREGDEEELYRAGGKYPDTMWQVRVLHNKFPFGPHHEVIIHSQDHHKSFGELPIDQIEILLHAYRQRYHALEKYGKVYLFHNHGREGGESLPHPHTQIVVIPRGVSIAAAPLGSIDRYNHQTAHFTLFCPLTSQWPDEVWIAPHQRKKRFSETTDAELKDLASILTRLVEIYNLRHGHEFPYNFYIYPSRDWYLRLVLRDKSLGGFEIGTGVFVNTQDPKETMAFIKEHFENPDYEKIKYLHKAVYKKGV